MCKWEPSFYKVTPNCSRQIYYFINLFFPLYSIGTKLHMRVSAGKFNCWVFMESRGGGRPLNPLPLQLLFLTFSSQHSFWEATSSFIKYFLQWAVCHILEQLIAFLKNLKHVTYSSCNFCPLVLILVNWYLNVFYTVLNI